MLHGHRIIITTKKEFHCQLCRFKFTNQIRAINIPSLHTQFMITVASLVSCPSSVQFPPLTQAHTSTIGTKTEEAPLVSLATKTRGSVVISCKVQRNSNSPSSFSSKTEFSGSPPRTLRVNSSPGSSTKSVKVDSSPRLTLNVASAEIFGGKLSTE